MALFGRSEDNHSRLDFRILQNGWTSLYWNKNLLDEDIQWFVEENFKVITLDCSHWMSKPIIHQDLKAQLGFPDYYGENWSALNDCLWDIDIPGEGLVIIFTSFEVLDKESAYLLLDIFADNSRQHALYGEKLITLVQVNDAHYECEPVAATPVLWNPKEWLDKDRGL